VNSALGAIQIDPGAGIGITTVGTNITITNTGIISAPTQIAQAGSIVEVDINGDIISTLNPTANYNVINGLYSLIDYNQINNSLVLGSNQVELIVSDYTKISSTNQLSQVNLYQDGTANIIINGTNGTAGQALISDGVLTSWADLTKIALDGSSVEVGIGGNIISTLNPTANYNVINNSYSLIDYNQTSGFLVLGSDQVVLNVSDYTRISSTNQLSKINLFQDGTANIIINGSNGTAGQVLTSDGSLTSWQYLSSANNGIPYTLTGTTAGAVIVNLGTGAANSLVINTFTVISQITFNLPSVLSATDCIYYDGFNFSDFDSNFNSFWGISYITNTFATPTDILGSTTNTANALQFSNFQQVYLPTNLIIPSTHLTGGGTITLSIYCRSTSNNHYLTSSPINTARIGIVSD
jgi:hypothetical protein